MKMPKPSEADRERFARLVPDDPRVETKPMFGNVGAFVNGNMFMALLGSSVGVKLDDAALAEVSAMDGARPFGPGVESDGKGIAGYVALPPAVAADPDAAAPIVAQALEHIGALPPKELKPRKPAK